MSAEIAKIYSYKRVSLLLSAIAHSEPTHENELATAWVRLGKPTHWRILYTVIVMEFSLVDSSSENKQSKTLEMWRLATVLWWC